MTVLGIRLEIIGHKTMSMVMRYTHMLDEHKFI